MDLYTCILPQQVEFVTLTRSPNPRGMIVSYRRHNQRAGLSLHLASCLRNIQKRDRHSLSLFFHFQAGRGLNDRKSDQKNLFLVTNQYCQFLTFAHCRISIKLKFLGTRVIFPLLEDVFKMFWATDEDGIRL